MRELRQMTEYPKISIVTPSFNQGKFLEKTILSVLEQDYPNLEYIIIDGGSTDESVEIIRKYEDRLTYWVSEPDRGQSHAINKGFEKATGEIFGWLNSDDYYASGALKAVVDAYLLNPDAGVVVGAGDMVDEEGNVLFGAARTTITLETLCNWFHEFFWQPSCFFKKEVWTQCGPLNEQVHYAMDLDLWVRIAKKFEFKTTDVMISHNLRHPKAKTTEFMHRSHVDAAMVIMHNVGEAPARHMLEDCLKIISERESSILELLAQRDRELSEIKKTLVNKEQALLQIKQEKQKCDDGVVEMRQLIIAVHNSLSWKLTAPLRSILRMISRQ